MVARPRSTRRGDDSLRALIAAVVGAGACAAAVLATLAPVTAGAQVYGGPTTVVVTITNSALKVAPVKVSRGTVVFKVANDGKIPRTFSIASKTTPVVAAGKSTTLKVSLPMSGSYLYLSYSKGHAARLSGVLTVVRTTPRLATNPAASAQPCANPVTSTIIVQMQEAPITLSRQTIPCGAVTFVVTNVGKMIHSLRIIAPGGTVTGKGPPLDPGQTVSLTFHLTPKGKARYLVGCGEEEHDELYGEAVNLSVV